MAKNNSDLEISALPYIKNKLDKLDDLIIETRRTMLGIQCLWECARDGHKGFRMGATCLTCRHCDAMWTVKHPALSRGLTDEYLEEMRMFYKWRWPQSQTPFAGGLNSKNG